MPTPKIATGAGIAFITLIVVDTVLTTFFKLLDVTDNVVRGCWIVGY